jgi:hypothetical protein
MNTMIALADAQPVPKDVVIATLGASAALTGLMLVFLGLLLPASERALRFSSQAAVDAEEKRAAVVADDVTAGLPEVADTLLEKTYKRLERAINLGSIALLLGLADIGLSLAWLALPGGHGLYIVSIWLFVLELFAIMVVVFFALPALSNLGAGWD